MTEEIKKMEQKQEVPEIKVNVDLSSIKDELSLAFKDMKISIETLTAKVNEIEEKKKKEEIKVEEKIDTTKGLVKPIEEEKMAEKDDFIVESSQYHLGMALYQDPMTIGEKYKRLAPRRTGGK